MNAIEIKNLEKSYGSGELITRVLRDIDLTVKKGEFLAIMGKSGAGKSTLIYQASLLDRPNSGSIRVLDVLIDNLSERERTTFRLEHLGYIFQDYALVPELTAEENVIMPLLMLGLSKEEALQRARATLSTVGLKGKNKSLPSQLSGGEQQRVSISRAVAKDPHILFADEPTANLDSVSSEGVLQVLKALHDEGQTIVMITHEKEYARDSNRLIFLDDGVIVKEEIQKKL